MLRSTFTTAAVLLVFAAPAAAQTTWTIDPNHSNAQFAVRHMMVATVRGEFGKLAGTVEFDGKNPASVAADVTIDATTVNTRVAMRDADLKSPNFLEVEKYPTLTFKSKKSEPAAPGRFKLTGDLTIHGVTREVVLDVEGPTAAVNDGRGNLRAGATATTKINRKDFGLVWNRAIEGGGVLVGDEVAITIDVEVMRKSSMTK